MASDYGDEAGGKLLDWMLRIGQEAGAEARARSARELSERLAGIRGTIAGGRAEEVAADVCSQINVDTFGGRFSTLHAKTCRPSPIKPNLIVATSSIQKGRKDNDQHVRR